MPYRESVKTRETGAYVFLAWRLFDYLPLVMVRLQLAHIAMKDRQGLHAGIAGPGQVLT